MSFSVGGRRYARRASFVRIVFAHPGSSAGREGLQTKTRLWLGDSPAPLGLSGPMISRDRNEAPSRVSRLSVGPRPMYGLRNGFRKPSDTASVFIRNVARISCV